MPVCEPSRKLLGASRAPHVIVTGAACANHPSLDPAVRDRQSGNASNQTRSRNDVDQPTRGGRGARVRGGKLMNML